VEALSRQKIGRQKEKRKEKKENRAIRSWKIYQLLMQHRGRRLRSSLQKQLLAALTEFLSAEKKIFLQNPATSSFASSFFFLFHGITTVIPFSFDKIL
jgi:hypothetical protein